MTSLRSLGGSNSNFIDEYGVPVNLKGDQAQATLNPEVRRRFPAFAAANEYQNMSPENGVAHRLGAGLSRFFNSPNMLSRTLDKGPMAGALTLGGLGAAAGYGVGALAGGSSEAARKRKRRAMLLGGALGAAAGAYSGAQRTKLASFLTAGQSMDQFNANARAQLVNMVAAASNLSFFEKQQAAQTIAQMSDHEAQSLLEVIMANGGGFAAGALIARLLLHTGIGGTLLGGMIGGGLSRAFSGGPPDARNAMGQSTLNHHDLFGNSLR